jgi:DNA-binding transcriptional ArsR family regulator
MPGSEVVLNEVGDVVVTDPETMLVLADRDRLALLDQLRRRGPSTVAELSAQSGVGESVITDQLRLFAGAGLVTLEANDDLEGPRWHAVGKGLYFEVPAEPFEAQQAARKLNNVMFLSYDDLPRQWVAEDEPRLELEWCRAAGLINARLLLTPEELRDIQAGLERLLEPYTTRGPEQAPADGRRVRILSYFLPESV